MAPVGPEAVSQGRYSLDLRDCADLMNFFQAIKVDAFNPHPRAHTDMDALSRRSLARAPMNKTPTSIVPVEGTEQNCPTGTVRRSGY